MRTGFGIPPVGNFMKANVPISFSVDTTILCGNADMFAIMKAIQNVEDGREQRVHSVVIHCGNCGSYNSTDG
jgi:5-methylthioadenosine/S-adenosylhomocysteine deaminase